MNINRRCMISFAAGTVAVIVALALVHPWWTYPAAAAVFVVVYKLTG